MHWIVKLCRVCRGLATLMIIFITATTLASCSKSVRKVSHVTQEGSEVELVSPDDDMSPIKNKSPEELLTLGYIYLENQNYKLAKLHFITALEKKSDFAEAYVGLGRMDMQNGQYTTAMNMFSKASEVEPGLVTALVGQAQALRFEGKMNAAVEKINAAMVIAPDDIMVINELAIIYDLMGHENLSEPLYQEVVSRTPDVASSHNNLGMNQMVHGKYPDAILSFLQALRLDKDNKRIKNNLATAYALNGDESQALQIFIRTVGEAAAYNNLGYLQMTQGRYDDAERSLKKAISTNPRFYQKAQDNLEKVQLMQKHERASN